MTDPTSRSHAISSASSRNTRQVWVLWRYWMAREFKTRYAGSVLGFAWAFVQPVATLAIFYVLFGLVLAVRVPGLDVDNGYLLHLLEGWPCGFHSLMQLVVVSGVLLHMRTFYASSPCQLKYSRLCLWGGAYWSWV